MIEERRKQIEIRLAERETQRKQNKIELKEIKKRSRSVNKKTPVIIFI